MWECVTTVFYHVCPSCKDEKQWLWWHWRKLCYLRAFKFLTNSTFTSLARSFQFGSSHLTVGRTSGFGGLRVTWGKTLVPFICSMNTNSRLFQSKFSDPKWQIANMLLEEHVGQIFYNVKNTALVHVLIHLEVQICASRRGSCSQESQYFLLWIISLYLMLHDFWPNWFVEWEIILEAFSVVHFVGNVPKNPKRSGNDAPEWVDFVGWVRFVFLLQCLTHEVQWRLILCRLCPHFSLFSATKYTYQNAWPLKQI